METTERIEETLKARAEKLAKRTERIAEREEKTPVSVVSAGAERFGIPTMYLSCIIKSPPIAKFPNLPEYLAGIAQIRGELVGVIDIASWFGVPGKAKRNFLAVIEDGGRKLGLLVDEVWGFRDIGASDIAETFTAGSTGGHPIHATTKDVTTILDIQKMFENPDMLVGVDPSIQPSSNMKSVAGDDPRSPKLKS